MFNLFKSKPKVYNVKTKLIEVEKEFTVFDVEGTAVLITGEIIPFSIESRVDYSKVTGFFHVHQGTDSYSKMIMEGTPLFVEQAGSFVYYPMSAIKSITAKFKENKITCKGKEEVPV